MIDLKEYRSRIDKTFNDKKSYLNKEVLHLRNTTHCVVHSKQNTSANRNSIIQLFRRIYRCSES